MAVENYNPIELSGCLDNAALDQVFQSLDALYQESLKGSTQIVCESFEQSLTHPINGGELCTPFDISNNILAPNAIQEQEKRIFLWTGSVAFRSVGGLPEDAPEPVQELNFSIRCGEREIVNDASSFAAGHAIYLCDPGEQVSFCIDPTSSVSGFSDLGGDVILSMCGSVLTFKNIATSPKSFYVPCKVDPDCCYGSDALFLIKQNLNALCESFSYGGQFIDSNVQTYADGDAHILDASFQDDTIWVVQGSISICIENTAPAPENNNTRRFVEYTITPRIGCGGEGAACADRTFRIYDGEKRCLQIPIQACGTCGAGDELIVSFSEIEICDDSDGSVAINVNRLQVTSIEQSYCVTRITRISNQFDLISRDMTCLTNELAEDINTKAQKLFDAACEIREPDCSTFEECKAGVSGDDFLVKPGDPMGTGTTTYFITGYIQFCARFTNGNNNANTQIESGFEIKCGGNVVYSELGRRWTFTSNGTTIQRCVTAEISRCVICDDVDDLIICPVGELWTGPPGVQVEIRWSSCVEGINLF